MKNDVCLHGIGSIKQTTLCWWGRRDLNPHGINSQRILSPLRLPISPLPQVMEVPIGLEPMITELQSIALPLGYGTLYLFLIAPHHRCYNII